MNTVITGFIALLLATGSAYGQMELSLPGMPPPGAPVRWSPPAVHEDVLPNGMRVLYTRVNAVPVVGVHVIIDAGPSSEPPNKSGVAYLTSELLVSGTTEKNQSLLSSELASQGTLMGNSIQYHSAQMYVSALKENLPQSLTVVANILTRPAFDSIAFKKKKETLLSDMLNLIDNPPDMTTRTLLKALYGENVPFAYSPQGRYRDVYDLTVQDCKDFYEARYKPNNTTLVITGDIDYPSFRSLLADRFGGWKQGAIPEIPAYTPNAGERSIIVIDNREVSQAIFRVGFPCTSRSTGDFEKLLLLNEVFGADRSSRLGRAFMGERILTPFINSGISFHRQSGYSVISGTIPGRYIDTALVALFQTIEFMKDSLVSPEELFEARKMYTDNFDLEFSTNRKTQNMLLEIATYGLPLGYYEDYIARFEAVTREDIRSVANALFDTPWVIVVTGDATVIAPALEERYGVPVQVMQPDEVLYKDRPVSYDESMGGGD